MKSRTRVALTVLIPALLAAMLVVAACTGGGNVKFRVYAEK